ncbi:MAG: cation diffusion facilitator family transporter [archaeon]
MKTNDTKKAHAAQWSIAANIFLLALKLLAGLYTGSLGIIAEFIHSFFDLIASILAYLGIKKASQPADETHHYGHERFENISSLLQSLLITLTSIIIIYEAYGKLTDSTHVVKESFIGIAVMAVTLIIDIRISRYLHGKSTETGSPALEADAYHFTTDILSTVAVIIGLAATALGYPIADVLSAIFVALIMLYISLNLGKKATFVMLDRAPDRKTIEKIDAIIKASRKVKSHHSLRARTAGNKLFVDVSVHLCDSLTLEEAHRISDGLEKKIIRECPEVKEIVIHMEPEQ